MIGGFSRILLRVHNASHQKLKMKLLNLPQNFFKRNAPPQSQDIWVGMDTVRITYKLLQNLDTWQRTSVIIMLL